MKVLQAEFVISAAGSSQLPITGYPEVALAGRSNVGKSSLINKLLSRKNLARTSSVPGKTQTLNYYKVNEAFYFVDVPGYGYAKVSKTTRHKWGKMIEQYLVSREPLKVVLQIVDLRHDPSVEDIAMYSWLKHNEVPVFIIATKADKVPKGKWKKHQDAIRDGLKSVPSDPIILFSSETGQGTETLWNLIEQMCELNKEVSEAEGV